MRHIMYIFILGDNKQLQNGMEHRFLWISVLHATSEYHAASFDHVAFGVTSMRKCVRLVSSVRRDSFTFDMIVYNICVNVCNVCCACTFCLSKCEDTEKIFMHQTDSGSSNNTSAKPKTVSQHHKNAPKLNNNNNKNEWKTSKNWLSPQFIFRSFATLVKWGESQC